MAMRWAALRLGRGLSADLRLQLAALPAHPTAPCAAPSPTQQAEVDSETDVAAGTTPGAKRAAVRKLLHELGIPPAQLPLDQFKFLTRLHYCAADTGGLCWLQPCLQAG